MYESSAIGAGTASKEISGVGDCLGKIREEFVEDPTASRTEPETNMRIEQSREYESPATDARTGARGGGESAEGVGDSLDLITEKFVGDLTPPRTKAETNTRIEQSGVHKSPATGVRTGANETLGGGVAEGAGDGLGLITEEFVEDPAAPRTESETKKTIEHSRVYESPATGARTGANEMSGGGGEVTKGVDEGLGLIPKEFVKDPAAPRTDDDTNSRIEQSRVYLRPTTGARTRGNEMSGGGGEGVEGVGDDLGFISMELVEDPAAPKTEAETNTKIEQSQGGEEVDVSPELGHSLEAMTLSTQNNRGETELAKDQNSSYTNMVSTAASKVYGIVADAGTAVISKVKPDDRKDCEDEAVGKKDKGISIKEYFEEKLTPGEDEKALSELITEVGQKRKNETVEESVPEGGKGVGVAEKIRETVTSFLGGGEGPPKSPATEAHRKAAEDNKDFHRRPPEAICHEKRSSEELPYSYHTDDTRIE